MAEPTEPKDPAKVLHLLPGGGNSDERSAALRAVHASLASGEMQQRHEVMALMMRGKYLALLKAGFNESEALHIVSVAPY